VGSAIPGGAIIASLVAITLTTYLFYGLAEGTIGALDEQCITVMVTFSALILMCIGIQTIWKGSNMMIRLGG
jgi:small neutral amino acid transporter SnatA (MarC family)